MKTYRVTGTRPVFGFKPGDRCRLDLPPAQEKRLLRSRALTLDPGGEDAGAMPSKSRAELNKLAHQAGVENPEALPNKDAVIEAIQGTQTTDQEPVDEPAPEGVATEPGTGTEPSPDGDKEE